MCEDNNLIRKLSEKLLDLEEKLESRNDDLDTWTNSLKELSEIEDAFGKDNLKEETILDIGTDCVKPLYIALKLKPKKIVGINEDLHYSYTSDIEQKAKLLISPIEMRFYDCSFFDDETLKRILKKENSSKKFNFVLVSKTLHHLRSGKCIANQRDEKHKCREDEECCIYEFEEQATFDKLLDLGNRVIVYEFFDPTDEDDDKIRGRGGYFTRNEWNDIFTYLSDKKYEVKFIRPQKFSLDKETLNSVDLVIRKMDYICFYVENLKNVSNAKNL